MNRRHLVMLLGFFSFGAAAMPRRLLALLQQPPTSEHVVRTMAAIANLMFPGDGLPGAAELGLHHRVLAMPDLDTLVTKGLAWLDTRAALQGAPDFLALDEAGGLAALDAAFASRDEGVQQFVLALRFHLGTGYYTEPAIKAAFAYTGPPQPDGFADFQERPA